MFSWFFFHIFIFFVKGNRVSVCMKLVFIIFEEKQLWHSFSLLYIHLWLCLIICFSFRFIILCLCFLFFVMKYTLCEKKKPYGGYRIPLHFFFCFPPPHLKKLYHKQYIHQNNQKNILKFMQLVLFKHILKPISTTQIATWCPPSGPLDGKCRKNLTCGGHK